MNVVNVDFQDLYQRHLCRHSQFGINVAHLASVAGTYWALCGLVGATAPGEWTLLGLILVYFSILVLNIPPRVFVVNVLFTVLILATFQALPRIAMGWYVLALLVFYKLQAWSHKIYRRETDMTLFNQKYRKGFALFVLLSIYEAPILLNYLFFGKKDWCA